MSSLLPRLVLISRDASALHLPALAAALSLCIGHAALAQSTPAASPTPPASNATAASSARASEGNHAANDAPLKFEATYVNLGPISDDDSAFRLFKFTNNTKQTLNLWITYCHFCSEQRLDKTVLKPGESGNVIMELDPRSKRGIARAQATVGAQGFKTQFDLELEAEVKPRIWIDPWHVLIAATSGKGGEGATSILARSTSFKIDRIESDSPFVIATQDPAEQVTDLGDPCTRVPIQVRISPDAPAGPLNARLTLQLSDPKPVERVISVEADIKPGLTIEPETVGMRITCGEIFQGVFELIAPPGTRVPLRSLDILERDEATQLGLDTIWNADGSRVLVVMTGVAPLRPRSAATLTVTVELERQGAAPEQVVVPVILSVKLPPAKPE